MPRIIGSSMYGSAFEIPGRTLADLVIVVPEKVRVVRLDRSDHVISGSTEIDPMRAPGWPDEYVRHNHGCSHGWRGRR